MRSLFLTILIKFTFQKRIHSAVQVEGVSRRLRKSQSSIDIETPWTVEIEIDLGAGKLKRTISLAGIYVSGSFAAVVITHDDALSINTYQ